ncbi:MAG: hypothetical protein ABSB35_29395 [Bryobacteraceae bacterium]
MDALGHTYTVIEGSWGPYLTVGFQTPDGVVVPINVFPSGVQSTGGVYFTSSNCSGTQYLPTNVYSPAGFNVANYVAVASGFLYYPTPGASQELTMYSSNQPGGTCFSAGGLTGTSTGSFAPVETIPISDDFVPPLTIQLN